MRVIQIEESYVLRCMYSSTYFLNTSPPLFKIDDLSYSFNKGLKVTNKEDWQDLMSNVSSRNCRVSFRKIFDHFFPLLIGQGLKSGLTKEVASELAQETMIKVWGQASSFDANKGNASVWIYTISRNVRYDYFRSKKNDPLKTSSNDLYSFEKSLVSDETELDTLFDLNLLKKHIFDLSPEQKDVIEKIYFDGFTQEEISQLQNIPLGTVKSRVRLAIAAMKEKFGGEIK